MKKITCLMLGALLCLSFCGCSNEKAANALQDAVYLEKPVLNPANEGKLVIIHGTAFMSKGAEDTDLNLQFDSPVVDRSVQVLEAQTKTTTIKTTTSDGKTTESQQIKKTDYVWKDVFNKNQKNTISKATFTGEAKLGDFIISGNTLKNMFADKNITVTKEMARKTGLTYWKQGISKPFLTSRRVVDRFMMSDSERRAENEGVVRISFTGREKQSKSDYTLAGTQQNGRLVSTKAFSIQCYAGNLTKEQMIEKNK